MARAQRIESQQRARLTQDKQQRRNQARMQYVGCQAGRQTHWPYRWSPDRCRIGRRGESGVVVCGLWFVVVVRSPVSADMTGGSGRANSATAATSPSLLRRGWRDGSEPQSPLTRPGEPVQAPQKRRRPNANHQRRLKKKKKRTAQHRLSERTAPRPRTGGVEELGATAEWRCVVLKKKN
ncbi:hypothetical protein EDB81DRAFT_466642 [Dactylonectria macrodidyma]|uniref:Uncharacterized protein n=1 Tax=Dactylonectria macrodidyma TaxID=307937 RepID=A0A9P9EYQ1_9HYPO|nr:hypothetical protein EDB81DRAFT_466642 [Dactylonectria macrodidyma]